MLSAAVKDRSNKAQDDKNESEKAQLFALDKQENKFSSRIYKEAVKKLEGRFRDLGLFPAKIMIMKRITNHQYAVLIGAIIKKLNIKSYHQEAKYQEAISRNKRFCGSGTTLNKLKHRLLLLKAAG